MTIYCPKCGSKEVATERRIDGNHVCGDCGLEWPNIKISTLESLKTDAEFEKYLLDKYIGGPNNADVRARITAETNAWAKIKEIRQIGKIDPAIKNTTLGMTDNDVRARELTYLIYRSWKNFSSGSGHAMMSDAGFEFWQNEVARTIAMVLNEKYNPAMDTNDLRKASREYTKDKTRCKGGIQNGLEWQHFEAGALWARRDPLREKTLLVGPNQKSVDEYVAKVVPKHPCWHWKEISSRRFVLRNAIKWACSQFRPLTLPPQWERIDEKSDRWKNSTDYERGYWRSRQETLDDIEKINGLIP